MADKPYTRSYDQLRAVSRQNLMRHLKAAQKRTGVPEAIERVRQIQEILAERDSPDWKRRGRNGRARPATERFEQHYIPEPNSGCWIWTASVARNGYGKFGPVSAHRFSYATFVGPIEHGKYVLHRCDVRCCVNPDHLFIGTAADNTRDMIAKGRGRWMRL